MLRLQRCEQYYDPSNACRSASLSTYGTAIAVTPSSAKNGDGRDFPSNMPFNTKGITVSKAFRSNFLGVPTGGVPCAKRPMIRLRTGPNTWSSFCASPSIVYTQRKKPAQGVPSRVLTIGVLQHEVEKRKVPFGDRRVHLRCSCPRRICTSAGYAGMTSVPPFASSRSVRLRCRKYL